MSFPRVERDVHQIEQFSQRLRAKAARGDPTAEALDASRLLAQEGLNPRRLNQALQTFELRPTYEDVFRPETASVGDYLRQVHELISAAAVQDVQRSAVAAFEGHMDACMEADWARQKRALLDSVEPFSAAATAAPTSRALPPGGPLLRGRAARYASVVRKINASLASGERYDAVADFAAACANDAAGDRRTTMLRVWQVLQRQLEGVYGLSSSARLQREAALIAGGRRYLEDNFVAFMQQVVATHRTTAALGGSPSRLGLVQAFLRVKEKDRSPLDFDQPGGADTTWLRIFTALRAGFTAEAVSVARAAGEGGPATPRAAAAAAAPRDLPRLLQEWADGGGRPLRGEAGAAAAAEAERLLRDKAARGREHHLPHRVAIYAILAGSNRALDALAREFPAFFPTIEDFMWAKLGLVRLGGGSIGGGASSASLETYSLSDLQRYLAQYPPSHFSHGGREPLLYAVVLLLSCQGAAAVAFLARDPSAGDYRLDAVHLGACLWAAGVIPSVKPGAASGDGDATPGRLLHQYGRSLAHGDAELALEYYMLSAAAQGGGLAVRGALLRELLTESRAYGLLLGAGGAGGEAGALAAFVPDAAERRAVLEAVASECAAAAQLEEAVELFMVAGRPRQALSILNRRLGDTLEAAAAEAGAAAEADTLAARAGAAAAALGASRDPEDLAEVEALTQLKGIRALLAAAGRGDHSRVLAALGDLGFVPTERYRLQVCAGSAGNLHSAVADRLQAVLLAAAEALAASGRWAELQTVVAFAAAVPNRVSQAAYQRLNQLQAASA
jgi:nuclear pore complex protein Nup93